MHVINRLYDQAHDFPDWRGARRRTFMLATVPRTGSTWFAIQLWQTGLLGAPMEYLNFPIMSRMLNRLGFSAAGDDALSAADIYRFWESVKRCRTSPNGIFGYKMFMTNFADIGRNYPGLLEDIAPDCVVYLTRESVLEQAVSYSIAIRSRTWFAGVKNAVQPEYDHAHIEHCIKIIGDQMAFWERVFDMTQVTPLRITYEGILQSRGSVLDELAGVLGVHLDPVMRMPIPQIDKQANATNAAWRHRFIEESSALSRATAVARL